MKKIQYILAGTMLVSLSLGAQAQTQPQDTTMNRTVVVEQEYNPDIMDASKVNVLPKVESLDQPVLRDAIRHERRVELGMEFDRFYDLVRWGIAEEVLHKAGKMNYQPKNALLPLPQTEIDKSKGVLVQNPNY